MFEKFSHWCRQWAKHYILEGENLQYLPEHLEIDSHDFLVRQASVTDTDILVGIEERVYHGRPWNQAAFASDLKRHRDRLYLVMFCGPRSVGYVGSAVNWFQQDMHITNIGVDPRFQDHGLGTFLIRELMRVGRIHGIKTMSLEVRAHNSGARRLYGQIGFYSNGLKHNYYMDNHEDAVDMTLDLQDEGNQTWQNKP